MATAHELQRMAVGEHTCAAQAVGVATGEVEVFDTHCSRAGEGDFDHAVETVGVDDRLVGAGAGEGHVLVEVEVATIIAVADQG